MDADDDAVMIATWFQTASIPYRFKAYGKLDAQGRPEFETVKVEAWSEELQRWIEIESPTIAVQWIARGKAG